MKFNTDKKQDTATNESMKLESYMLPPQFRRRTRWIQRFLLISISMIYAFAMGLILYLIMGDFKEKFHILTKHETTLFLVSIMMPAILLFLSLGYTSWSRSKSFIIGWNEVIGYLITPLAISAGIIYLNTFKVGNGKDIHFLMKWIGYFSIGSIGLTVLFTFGSNIVKHKTYREAKYRTIWTTPGILAAGIAPLLLDIMIGSTDVEKISSVPMLTSGGVFLGGIVLLAMGMSGSVKYLINTNKNIWNSIKYASGLPSIVLYTMMTALALGRAMDAKIIMPIIIHATMEGILLLSFIVYLFIKARIKNMNSTNPLYNELALKTFVIISLTITSVMIYMLPGLSLERSYGMFSFLMLVINGFVAIAGITIAHFMNLITYVKYGKVNLVLIGIAALLIYGIALSIASLKQSGIIAEILGRELALTFAFIALMIHTISLSINIFYVFVSFAHRKGKLKKAEETLKEEEKEMKLKIEGEQ